MINNAPLYFGFISHLTSICYVYDKRLLAKITDVLAQRHYIYHLWLEAGSVPLYPKNILT